MPNELVPKGSAKGLYKLAEAESQYEMQAMSDTTDPSSLHAELVLLKYMLQQAVTRKDTREAGALVDLITKTAKAERISLVATSEFVRRDLVRSFLRVEAIPIIVDAFRPFLTEREFADTMDKIEATLEARWGAVKNREGDVVRFERGVQ